MPSSVEPSACTCCSPNDVVEVLASGIANIKAKDMMVAITVNIAEVGLATSSLRDYCGLSCAEIEWTWMFEGPEFGTWSEEGVNARYDAPSIANKSQLLPLTLRVLLLHLLHRTG